MYQKNATALLDYTLDYNSWIGSTDAIASAAWQVPAGISAVSSANSVTAATIWLSGGTPGNVYRVTNQIWTVSGRVQLEYFEVGIA